MKIHQTPLLTLAALLLLCVACVSCEKEEKKSYFHKVDPVRSIYVTLVDDDHRFVTNQNAPYGHEIEINFPKYYPTNSTTPIDISKLELHIEFNNGIEVQTEIPDVIDLTNPLILDITN